jgi:hypothetical protein
MVASLATAPSDNTDRDRAMTIDFMMNSWGAVGTVGGLAISAMEDADEPLVASPGRSLRNLELNVERNMERNMEVVR